MARGAKKTLYLGVLCGALLLVVSFLAPGPGQAFEITIDVAPNVLNIQNQGVWVTVHTDIAYGAVNVASVFLNNVPIEFAKMDARGYFVAKFVIDEIKGLDGLVLDDYNTMTLVGNTTDGEAFSGTQDIKVIDVQPSGR